MENKILKLTIASLLGSVTTYAFDRQQYTEDYCPTKYLDCSETFPGVKNVFLNEHMECIKEKVITSCEVGFHLRGNTCKKPSIKTKIESGYDLRFRNFSGPKNWVVKNDMTVLQTANNPANFFMFNKRLKNNVIVGKVKIIDDDNDSWGFVFPITNGKFILFDWRKSPQSWDGKTAKAGPFLSVIKGNYAEMGLYNEISFSREKRNKQFEVLKEKAVEDFPWVTKEWMNVKITIDDDKLRVSVNSLELEVEEDLLNGVSFGLYNQSQPNVMYYDFKVEDKYDYSCNIKDKTILSKSKKWCTKPAILDKEIETKKPVCNYCKPQLKYERFDFSKKGLTLDQRINMKRRELNSKKKISTVSEGQFLSFVELGMDVRDAVEALGAPTSTNLVGWDTNLRECHYNNVSFVYDLENSYSPYKKSTIRTIKSNLEVVSSTYQEIEKVWDKRLKESCEYDRSRGYYNRHCD